MHLNSFHSVPQIFISESVVFHCDRELVSPVRRSFYWSPYTCDTRSLHGLVEESSCAAVSWRAACNFVIICLLFPIIFFFFLSVNSVEILTAALQKKLFWQLCRDLIFFAFLYLVFFVSDAFRTLENNLQYLLRCVLHFNHQSNKAILVSQSKTSPLLGSVIFCHCV